MGLGVGCQKLADPYLGVQRGREQAEHPDKKQLHL
jgi:hypothetical protein